MGKLGAVISHQLVYNGFGLAAFSLIAFFFILGYRLLLAVKIVSLRKTLAYTLAILLYLPLLIAFINNFSGDGVHYSEGVYGFQTNIWLNIILGKVGTGFLLLFLAFSAVVFIFNPSFSFLRRKAGSGHQEEPSLDDDDENVRNVNLEDEIIFDPIELNPKEREKGAETKTINDFFAEKFGRKRGGEETGNQETEEAKDGEVTGSVIADAGQQGKRKEDGEGNGGGG